MAQQHNPRNINDFLGLTSNLTALAGTNNKITFFYVFKRIEYDKYWDMGYALAIAKQLHNLQNIEKFDVIFNCLMYESDGLNWFCRIVEEKLSKSHFIFLAKEFYDKEVNEITREYVLDVLKNPRYNRYGNLRCTEKVSILFWYHQSDRPPLFLRTVFGNKFSNVVTVSVRGVIQMDNTPSPSELLTFDGRFRDDFDQRDYNAHYVKNYIKTSKKIIKINIIHRQNYYPERFEFLRKFTDGELINVVIDDWKIYITESPKLEGRNTIEIWPEHFYEPIFINMLIEKINQVSC